MEPRRLPGARPGALRRLSCPARPLGGIDPTPELQGGLIPQLNWFAPGLAPTPDGASKQEQRARHVALLKTGLANHASASGPMVEVVFKSTQHLHDVDLEAIGLYLSELPVRALSAVRKLDAEPPAPSGSEAGRALYKDRCAGCHGEAGEGAARAYPALAGSTTVVTDPPANLVRMILEGGFPPATAGNPRPYGMPPFGQDLSRSEIAALVSFVRSAWGNRASAVSALEVNRYR